MLMREKRVYNRFDADVDQLLEDLESDTEKRYRPITLQVLWWFVRFGYHDH